MSENFWASPKVIGDLCGLSKLGVSRAVRRFNWPWIRSGNAKQKLYRLSAVERDLKLRFDPAEVKLSIERNSRVAGVFSE
ncbi:hypothetical protein [Hyphomicrobium sulfonivorans]|uniref:hypothetical protein n=1 Tax=Hyphomicrobium sulfonivorans TaxID=121290 RepID=UPI0015705E23|nr:hypothetical protein [Hyphomicrobium sulfonivorans]MBI1651161.1 hypothetical protein [Hyphomicrobium sulfonivorans]NSL72455.1 hypothetical protein [Hyphomicrobium sulfonivorans]